MKSDLVVYSHVDEIIDVLNEWSKKCDPKAFTEFYDIRNLLRQPCEFLMSYGKKSNGKSTKIQMVMLICFWLYGYESVLLRLYDEDFKQGRAEKMFNGVPASFINFLTKGEFDCIKYKFGAWYFGRYDENSKKADKIVTMEKAFCYRIHIVNCGSSFQIPNAYIYFFDEFIRKDSMRAVPHEFVEFMTVLSTLKRRKTNVQVFMAGNTVNFYSPYFIGFHINKMIRHQPQGTIKIMPINSRGGTIACEYCKSPEEEDKDSDRYFTEDSQTAMITEGAWQLDEYPKLPFEYNHRDIDLTFYIIFNEMEMRIDLISKSIYFVLEEGLEKIVPKPTDKDKKHNQWLIDNGMEDQIIPVYSKDVTCLYCRFLESYETIDFNEDIIYQEDADPRPNIFGNIYAITQDWQKIIYTMVRTRKIFYDSNEAGDLLEAYLKRCMANLRK